MARNNVISDSGPMVRKPDNPQETLDVRKYYYAGLFAAEMTCSVIRATNHHPQGYYYTVDFTVSNADKPLLEEVNEVVMKGRGVISPIKGAWNLKARGKENVRIVLTFLRQYPILAGDLAINRVVLLEKALAYLDVHHGHGVHEAKTVEMERIQHALRQLKTDGIVETTFPIESAHADAAGHFLAGVLDGEGSFGVKRCGTRKEPFIMMAMKDRKIVELLREFIQCGNIRWRKDGVYHLEVNQRSALKRLCEIFLNQYPLRHSKQRQRMEELQRILNDHTPRSDIPYRI